MPNPPNKYQWHAKELQFIKDNFFKLTNQQLADTLGLKLTSVRTKCLELGLKRMELEYWTKGQVGYLKRNYKTKGDTEIAEYFNKTQYKAKGWTIWHIEKKRRYLGLKRTPEQIKKIQYRNIKKGRFAMRPVKAWITRGGPAPVGELRQWHGENSRPFIVIKTKAGFVHYAPWLWRKHFGKIPARKIVTTKDGNQLNIVPENLKLITRAQHARNNSKNRMPSEISEIQKLINQLNQKIIKHEKQNK